MPPSLLRRLAAVARSASPASDIQPYLAAEKASWLSPNDTLSILMIIGGDIVQRAVAQLAGSGPFTPYWHFTPVAFSFGWLAYSVSALTSALGDGQLMPPPDCPIQVVNARTGYQRQNASWVLGRLFRDHEKRRMKGGSLTVAFYRTAKDEREPGLAISVIPGALHGNWIVLIVTVGGTLLALVASGLPQWREEKYLERKINPQKGPEVVCLTRGNGSTFVMVVVSETGIRLEALAGGARWTQELHRGHGSVVELAVDRTPGDGAERGASAHGFHFEPFSQDRDVVEKGKVMATLMAAEERQPGVGLALLKLFFPGDLRLDEQEYWDKKKLEKAEREAITRKVGKETGAGGKSDIAAGKKPARIPVPKDEIPGDAVHEVNKPEVKHDAIASRTATQ
ncbi:hypothetical protein ONZ51_g5684 [Trametes cubensis]|uniref:Uncharacterized protein n=1 Tax=Trametes cubensis TaxID=1111947 RepID=A0AAD7TTY1_9APHY|nr:hypothetical protein ONZ51_g5684 [Trametes cubensis]